jgi:hypothetical protein
MWQMHIAVRPHTSAQSNWIPKTWRPEGLCTLIIIDVRQCYILGVHVPGEYWVEIIQMVAA